MGQFVVRYLDGITQTPRNFCVCRFGAYASIRELNLSTPHSYSIVLYYTCTAIYV